MRKLAGPLALVLLGVAGGMAADRLTGVGEVAQTTRRRLGVEVAQAIFRVGTHQKVVALTFDDGPDPRWTPIVLDLLTRRNIRATFFVVGKSVDAHPDLLARELAEGHTIGNHTYDHLDLASMTPGQVNRELERGGDAIERAGAPRPTLFRPPKGRTDEIVGVLADARRYRTILWQIAVERFVDHLPVEEAVRRMLARIGPGAIILAHDGGGDRTRTMEALPLLLDGLQRRGFEVTTVDDLLRRGRR